MPPTSAHGRPVAAADVGNSALKLARLDPCSLRIVDHASTTTIADCHRFLAEGPAGQILVSSVRPRFRPEDLAPDASWGVVLAAKLLANCPIRFPAPLDVGEDRKLACVAAAGQLEQPFAVATIGTAATLSIVTENACDFAVIWAGPALQLQALRANTRLDVPLDLPSRPLQLTTGALAESINAGLVSSLAFTLEQWLAKAEGEYGRPLPLVLTGGYAPAVSLQLGSPHEVEPLLTIEGLIALAARRCDGEPDEPRRSGD